MALGAPGGPAAPAGPGWLTEAARDFTALGSTAVLAFVVAADAGYLAMCGRAGEAVLLVGAVLFDACLVVLHVLSFPGVSNGECVLAAEGDTHVIAMTAESLRDLGYLVLTAETAQEALDVLRRGARIDILFSDVVMPGGMNGVQLAVEARRLRPGLRVLLTSGYTGAALDAHAVPQELPLFGKPYGRDELAHKLRVVLQER